MRGREGGGGSACSGCGRSEGQSEAMVVLMCLSARKTYIREVQGHYGPVAGLGLLFPFNIFLFFSFSMLLCFYFLQWYAIVLPPLITPRRCLCDWMG
jgi:hypothetical protein